MNKNLNRLLASFSDSEWDRFRDFLQSPFFVKGRNYMGFYNILRENIKGKEDYSKLTPEFIINHFGEKLNATTLNNRLSELYKLALEFLFQLRAEKDEIGIFALTFEELTDRKLYANTNYLYSLVKNKVKPPGSKDYPSYIRILKAIADYHRSINDFEQCFKLYNEHNTYFTAYSLEMILEFTIDYKSIKHPVIIEAKERFGKIFQSINFRTLIDEFKDEPLFVPVVLIYYITEALLNEDDEKLYLKAFNYLRRNYEVLTSDTRMDFNLKLQSYCVMKIMKGYDKFYEYYLDIVKNKLSYAEYSFLGLNQYPFSDFHDIVKVALSIDETEWADKFIRECSPMLNPLTAETDKLSALISLAIKKKDFSGALELIRGFNNSNNKFHNIEFYIHRIIIYYELDKEKELEQSVNNLYNYVRKHSELSNELNKIDLFIRNVNRLKNIKTKTRRKVEEYILFLENPETRFLNKKWVLEKVKAYFERNF